MSSDLKNFYTAITAEEAELNLEKFAEKWDSKYPTVSRQWRSHWENITPFFCVSKGYSQGDLHDKCD